MDTEALIDGEKTTFTWTDDTAVKDENMQQVVAALHGGDNDTIGDWSTWEVDENLIARAIAVRILVRSRHGTETRQLRTDFGVGTESTTDVDEAGIIVSPDCGLGVEALKNLIAEAIFEYSYDDRDDSPETQWVEFMDNAHAVAARLRLNEHEAVAEIIRQAARTHLGHLLPDDRTVQLPETAGGRRGTRRRRRRGAPRRPGVRREVNARPGKRPHRTQRAGPR